MSYLLQAPIDAVITWVDGNDETHRHKRAVELAGAGGVNEVYSGRDNTRFLESGELAYCLRSIRQFAPWIRTIHLITDNQTPDFLTPEICERYRINIVDHRDIFSGYEWALPTFNSRSIESALWRIPDLAPQFIYLNDDFIITSPVEESDFFGGEGVVLRGYWNRMRRYGKTKMHLTHFVNVLSRKLLGVTRSMHLLTQIKAARMAGFTDRYFRSPHVPHPIRTDTLKQFFDEHPDLFEANIRHTFRSTDQFSTIALANHLEIANRNATLVRETEQMDLDGELDLHMTINRKLRDIEKGEVKFLCLQAFEKFRNKDRDAIIRVLDSVAGSRW